MEIAFTEAQKEPEEQGVAFAANSTERPPFHSTLDNHRVCYGLQFDMQREYAFATAPALLHQGEDEEQSFLSNSSDQDSRKKWPDTSAWELPPTAIRGGGGGGGGGGGAAQGSAAASESVPIRMREAP